MVPSLTREERERFAAWLEWEAQTDEKLIEQMMKINTPDSLMRLRRLEVLAAITIARKLRGTTDESIG